MEFLNIDQLTLSLIKNKLNSQKSTLVKGNRGEFWPGKNYKYVL